MTKEKRLKTKVIQVRVTPSDYDIYNEYAKKNNISKTKLFEKFLQMIKEERI